MTKDVRFPAGRNCTINFTLEKWMSNHKYYMFSLTQKLETSIYSSQLNIHQIKKKKKN